MTNNDLWYTARGAGLAAMLLLTLSTSLGLVGAIRMRSVTGRVLVQYLHRTAAGLGLALIVVHVTTMVLDSKSHVSLSGALVPFAAQYRPNAVALGSIAMYVFLFVAALGLARGRLAVSPTAIRVWRGLHLLAIPAWVTAVVHGLLAGTDRGQGWVVLLTLACVAAVSASCIVRVLRLDDGPIPATTRSATPRPGAMTR